MLNPQPLTRPSTSLSTGNLKPIYIWLLTGCFLIFVMVVVGGITRLTGSGLSITEWAPIMGAIPPMNDAEWQVAFEKYQQIPQFQKVNSHFSLNDFKYIFWWEFIHRLLGRLIGVVFIVPFVWFLAKRMLDKQTLKKAVFLFLLGGLQGVIGWLMVKSGLTERTSVSHIRLAIHLITAFITFGFTFYFALQLIYPDRKITSDKSLPRLINMLLIAVVVQIIYGAFVAGMHAGKIYNTFPLMNGQVIPDGISVMNPFWINIFENPVTVQFIHRMFAGIITLLTIYIFIKFSKSARTKAEENGMIYLGLTLAVQVIIGVLTLLSSVEITLASLHQVGAFFLFSSCIYLKFLYNGE